MQASTTSPVVASPCCQSRIAQASRPSVSTIVTSGVKDAQLLQIEQAAPARVHLALDGGVEAAMLAQKAAECAHQRHVADDVDHFAVDRGRLVGEIVVQRPAGGGEAEHDARP